MILLDTSGLLSAMFADQRDHHACANALLRTEEALLLSPFILGEVDSIVAKHAGADTHRDFLEEVSRGAYRLTEFTADDVRRAKDFVARYRKLRIGLAEASIAVLAEKHGAREVLTLDRRFDSMRTGGGKRFKILPE